MDADHQLASKQKSKKWLIYLTKKTSETIAPMTTRALLAISSIFKTKGTV